MKDDNVTKQMSEMIKSIVRETLKQTCFQNRE